MSEAKQDDLYSAGSFRILTVASIFTLFHDEAVSGCTVRNICQFLYGVLFRSDAHLHMYETPTFICMRMSKYQVAHLLTSQSHVGVADDICRPTNCVSCLHDRLQKLRKSVDCLLISTLHAIKLVIM